jgi:RNA-directed DNA polymerase
MNGSKKSCALDASNSTTTKWETINWDKVEKEVKRLQMRIAKAEREKKRGRVKSLQWVLTHSLNAKLLAIKRVTSNKGKNTAGIDGITWNTGKKKTDALNALKRRGYKPLPMRRIYIPKKNGKLRPLSIPSMNDRAMQAVYLLALEPVAETTADPNSYGFRSQRGCHDAIEQCFICLSRRNSSQWILDADIKACFDEINHEWIINNVQTDKKILKAWLKAGYIESNQFFQTDKGTPQGGIISPTIANITLDGLESHIKNAAARTAGVNFVRYADDFIVTAKEKETLIHIVIPAIENFLKERGLILSKEKTRIVHVNEGFDFLSQNIRKYKEKLLIKPTKSAVKSLLGKVKKIIKSSGSLKTEALILQLNSVLRGWGNYHKHIVSKAVFNAADNQVFILLTKWAKKRHSKKGWVWIKKKYLTFENKWCVFNYSKKTVRGTEIFRIFSLKYIPIKRYIKIQAKANPYNPDFLEYFQKRKIQKLKMTKETFVPTYKMVPVQSRSIRRIGLIKFNH